MITWYNKFTDWLFGTPTQVLEALHALFALSWGIALLDGELLIKPTYSGFIPPNAAQFSSAGSVLFFVVAVFQVFGARSRDKHNDLLSGYSLKFGSFLWFVVAMNFAASYPPLNTGILVYLIFSAFCWITGHELFRRNKRESADV